MLSSTSAAPINLGVCCTGRLIGAQARPLVGAASRSGRRNCCAGADLIASGWSRRLPSKTTTTTTLAECNLNLTDIWPGRGRRTGAQTAAHLPARAGRSGDTRPSPAGAPNRAAGLAATTACCSSSPADTAELSPPPSPGSTTANNVVDNCYSSSPVFVFCFALALCRPPVRLLLINI